MKERPILFSTPMVQAIMEGRKTQTRRIAKGHALQFLDAGLLSEYVSKQDLCPYGELGDILWVRETWALPVDADGNDAGYQYKADYSDGSERWKWKPSIHMQKSACRLFLQITYIAIERLNDISDDDAIAEGIIGWSDASGFGHPDHDYPTVDNPVESYKSLWKKINGEESWNENPWVWVIEFKRIKRNG
jgi:hypothetical protein